MEKSLTISNYKCFNEKTEFELPGQITLVIGRNNSGKTTFSEILEYFYSNKNVNKSISNLSIGFVLNENIISAVFPQDVIRSSLGFYNSKTQYEFGKELIGETFFVNIERAGDKIRLKGIDPEQPLLTNHSNKIVYSENDWRNLAFLLLSRHDYFNIFKITSERDIRPEKEDDGVYGILPNGEGATAIVDKYLYDDGNDYEIIKNDLLDALNELLAGECHFTDIETIKTNNTKMICLKENKRRIKLNDMGSGLKTILLTLLTLFLNKNVMENSFLIFEELENNLHPEIQRRLFNFLYDFSLKNNCKMLITSHSNISINCFYGKQDACIYSVTKEFGKSSQVKKIRTVSGLKEILDNLGVKASDIFQSNGIIWVEGPSDRVYLNKWINLIDPELKENVHYTFLYYGGRLLSHYTASEQEQKDFIDILLTNRNSAIMIDSDIKEPGSVINPTKQRIVDEFAKNNHFCWVTKGREIENYLSKNTLNRKYSNQIEKQIAEFDDFKDYIKDFEPNFEAIKVKFARALDFTKDDLDILDLKEKVTELVANIKKWNY